MSPESPADPSSDSPELAVTPLHDLHIELGGRMVPFAGYDMPVQYEGVVAEHTATRTSAGLFDVSHMGVVEFHGEPDEVGTALETVLPSAIVTLKPGRQRYSFLTNEGGGVVDDLMVTRSPAESGAPYSAVLNASRKHVDLAHLRTHLDEMPVDIVQRPDLALLAVQGPMAVEVVARLAPKVVDMKFMDVMMVPIDDVACSVSRSGYTGEDGVEITIPGAEAERIARLLLTEAEVTPSGLGARDTLRLEAGLCLYGHELAEDISPVEADLVWAMQKRRRENGGFVGDDVILSQLRDGVQRRRVGLRANGRRPVRDGAALSIDGVEVGLVTSGGFGPTVEGPIAMGLVDVSHTDIGTVIDADVRGKTEQVTVVELPFAPHRYAR